MLVLLVFHLGVRRLERLLQAALGLLRGPVETAEEKARIEAITASADGVRQVDNQLEVENGR